MSRRLPRLRAFVLSCGLLLGVAAGVWWTLSHPGAHGGPPTRPSVHTITVLHQGLRVYWYEPDKNGRSRLTDYEVHYRASGAPTWSDAGHRGLSQPAVIAGLSFNTSYEVRVRARNADGAGPWSMTESRRTLPNDGRPDPPKPPVLKPADGLIEVSWTAPAYTGGRPITGYRVRYTTDAAATWRSWEPGGNGLIKSTTTTISGFDNGQTVGVVVAAVNGCGQGRYSSPIVEVAPVQALSPALRAQTAASGSVKLSWSDGPRSATLWEYRWRLQDGVWDRWTRIADSDAETTEHVVSGLTEDVRYDFIVRAYTAAGAGSPSNVASAVAGLTPTEPIVSLWYGDYDASGGATTRGSYAVLSDATDLLSGITSFASASTAEAILLNVEGYGGRQYADFLDQVAVGDTFTWLHTPRCWFAYRVTKLLSDSSAPDRKLFAIKLTSQDPCAVQIRDPGPSSFDRINWGPPPNQPFIGIDGVRFFPDNYPVAGGHTYRLTEYGFGISRIVIDVPAGMRLVHTGVSEEFGGYITVWLRDEVSGAILALDYDTGAEVVRYIPEVNGSDGGMRDVGALLDAIAASARVKLWR